MSKDSAYLADMLEAAKAIRRFVTGVTRDEFLSNEEKYEAVNRKLEILGEAARHLSPEGREQFPGIPWRLITAMRNILIHDYAEVDLNIVWQTTQDDLPSLIETIEEHLARIPPPLDEEGSGV